MPAFCYNLIFFLCLTNVAFANIAEYPKPMPGDLSGQNAIKFISVLHETLNINLEGVARGERATINAYYSISSPTTLRNVELIFVANNLSGTKYLVELDGKPVNGYLAGFDTIPSNWNPPDSIPFLDRKIPFNYTFDGLISFTLDSITPGEHTLEVAYDADIAEWFEKKDFSVTRAFVYILKPSDGWREFKDLDLFVTIPEGWTHSSNLEFTSTTAANLEGHWNDLPAHHLSIVFKPNEQKAKYLPIVFVILLCVFSFYVIIKWIVKVELICRRIRNKVALKVLNNLLVSFTATVVFYLIYFNLPNWQNYYLDEQLNPGHNHGRIYAILYFPILWAMALIPVAILHIIVSQRTINTIEPSSL